MSLNEVSTNLSQMAAGKRFRNAKRFASPCQVRIIAHRDFEPSIFHELGPILAAAASRVSEGGNVGQFWVSQGCSSSAKEIAGCDCGEECPPVDRIAHEAPRENSTDSSLRLLSATS
jgi:hypothetical protein